MDIPERKNTKKHKRSLLKNLARITLEALSAAVLIWILFIVASKYLCRAALQNISQKTGTQITVDKMQLNLNGSVEIEGLSVKAGSEPYNEPILKAQKTKAYLSLSSIFLFKPRIKRISISEPAVNLVYDGNNKRWNLPSMRQKAAQIVIDELPIIYLNNGKFIYSKADGKNKTVLAWTGFRGLFVSQREQTGEIFEKNKKVFHFELDAEQWSNFGAIRLIGTIHQGRVEMRGSMLPKGAEKNTILQVENVKAVMDYSQNGDYSLAADVNNFNSGQRLFAEHFTAIRTLSTDAERGRKFQNFLDKGQVKGTLDGEFVIRGNLSRIMESSIAGKVYCKNILYCDKSFEYPIEEIRGHIDVTEASAELKNLEGRHKDAVFFINGRVSTQQEQTRSHIIITSNKVRLDKDAYSALSSEGKRIWDDFSPSGTVAIEYTFTKETLSEKEFEIKITSLDCRAVWKKLAYPLNNITGNLFIRHNEAELVNLISTNGIEKVIVDGKIAREKPDKTAFDIKLSAENIEPNSVLNQIQWTELSSLFQIKKPPFLDDVSLKGPVNFEGNFKKKPEERLGDFNIKLNLANNSLVYSRLPYKFNELKGDIYIQNNLVRFENLRATSDNLSSAGTQTQITIGGQLKMEDSSFNIAELKAQVKDAVLDERFGAIMPKINQSLYFKLKPTGLFDLNIEKLKISNSNDRKIFIEASGAVNLHQATLNTEPLLTHLQGPINFEIFYKSGEGLYDSKINAQDCTIIIKEKILTGLNAEVIYNQNNKSWHSENITADFYDGKMNGKAELNENAAYVVNAGFDGIDLRKFLSEPVTIADTNSVKKSSGSDYTQGRMDASVSFAGQLGQDQSNLGSCRLKIVDMKVGKVSVFGKLLNILQLTEPPDFVFEQMAVDSYISSGQLLLKVDISGRTTAFEGEGIMNLRGMIIDLLLNAHGKRLIGTSPGPLQTLTEGLSQGIVQISIRGNVYSPQIEVVPLPVIRKTLGLFGTEQKSPKK